VAVVYLGWPLRDVTGCMLTRQEASHRRAPWLSYMFSTGCECIKRRLALCQQLDSAGESYFHARKQKHLRSIRRSPLVRPCSLSLRNTASRVLFVRCSPSFAFSVRRLSAEAFLRAEEFRYFVA